MKPGYVLLTITFFSLWLSWLPAHAMQDDPVLIRGPVGSERTDVRQGTEQYGPVAPTDTLWGIATRFRPHSGVTLAQVMVAILHANPHAFLDNNPNALESGYLLRIPSVQEMRMINPEAARRQIELGEQIQLSSENLQRAQAAIQQTDSQRIQLLDETRQQAEQTLAEVRGNYASEFDELRERLSRSIASTETVIAENEDLRERLNAMNATLAEIQRTMVAETQFQQQVRELMEEQQALRLQQQTAQEMQGSQGGIQSVLNSPWALLLLAFVPALILIIIATLVLRRKQVNAPSNMIAHASHASHAEPGASLAASPADKAASSEQDIDDFELDQAMAEFDDLDDEGDDLSALEDEMLVPHDEDDDSLQLDDDLDNMDLSDFDALDDDLVDEFSPSSESDTDDQDQLDATEDNGDEAASQQLSQSDLDALFTTGGDDEGAQPEPSNPEEPSPSALFELMDEDSSEETSEETLPEEPLQDDADELSISEALDDDDDDYDFERMLEQFADDEDDDLSEDDIDSLLAKSDQMINHVATEESEPSADEEETETPAPVNADQADSFIDIDSILEEAESEPEDSEEEPQAESSRRADAEDNLAAQLDLARAYMEMGEHDEARDTIAAVVEQASGELLEDAKELLSRLDS